MFDSGTLLKGDVAIYRLWLKVSFGDVVLEDKIPRTPDELFHPKRVKDMWRIMINMQIKIAKYTNNSGLYELSYDLSREKSCSFHLLSGFSS